MKNFIHSIGFLFFLILSISQSCFSQDTCFVTLRYGENSETGRFAKVNGIQMYYETYGDISKQPLLLIHGNGGSVYWMKCQIEHFKHNYYIIAADSRFHGLQ